MTLLSVNVNKIATLRNSRGSDMPNVKNVSEDCLKMGCHGITVHPRPDQRHIKPQDVIDLKNLLLDFNLKNKNQYREFNIEGYPSEEFLEFVLSIRPDQVTFVPDPPDVITSNAGWKITENKSFLIKIINMMSKNNIRSSIFIDPKDVHNEFLKDLAEIRPNRVELYTEEFAKSFGTSKQNNILDIYKSAAQKIHQLEIGLNAGHDLNQKNLSLLLSNIPMIKEVSIGHALFCEAIYEGLALTISNYLEIVNKDYE